MKRFIFTALVIALGIPAGYVPGEPVPAETSNDRNKTYADTYYRTASTVHAPLYGPLAEYIVGTYGLTDITGLGIDIGGGPGHLAVELARRTPGMHWINADINPYFFTYTRSIADTAHVGHRISTLRADVQDLPLKDNVADIIVSRGSFQLWNDKIKAFSEIYRVLKTGGVAFVGRGFSPNLPPEIARTIRSDQSARDSSLSYSPEDTAAELETIMKTIGIGDYTISIPHPSGSEGIRYGIWLEFHKPGPRRSIVLALTTTTDTTKKSAEPVYVLEPLEVKGSRTHNVLTEPLLESPGLQTSTSVIDRKEIEREGADTVIEAMEYVPGALIETRGRKVKQFFSVRGQQYPYPDYAIDGALYREFFEMPYFFSIKDIERIEVMRSSASMLTGISGLGGVINIVPREYTVPETSWELEYGSFNSYRFHLSHGGTVGNVSYALGLGAPHTDGPDNRHAHENMMNFYGNIHWRPSSRFSLHTTLFHLYGKRELEQAVPPATEQLQNADEQFDPVQGTFAQMKLLYFASERASTEFHASYSDRKNWFISQTDSTYTINNDWDFEWSLNLVQSLALSSQNIIRVGGFYNRWVAPYGARFYSGRRNDLSTVAGVVVDEHRAGKLLLDAGLRWQRTYLGEYGAYNINGSAQGFGKVPSVTDTWEPSIYTASIGASYELTGAVTLNANAVAGTIRPRPGTLDTDLKEPDNEQRVKVDAGVETRVDAIGDFMVTGFFVQQKRALVLSGKTKEVAGRLHELWLNRDQDQLGIELEVRSVQLYRTVTVFFNLAAMRSRVESNGEMKRNTELPRVIAGGGISITRNGYDLNCFEKSVSSYENARFAASAPVPQPLGEYTTINLTAGKTFNSKLGTRVYIEATNLTDRKFSTVVGYPDYGRRFAAGLRQTFK